MTSPDDAARAAFEAHVQATDPRGLHSTGKPEHRLAQFTAGFHAGRAAMEGDAVLGSTLRPKLESCEAALAEAQEHRDELLITVTGLRAERDRCDLLEAAKVGRLQRANEDLRKMHGALVEALEKRRNDFEAEHARDGHIVKGTEESMIVRYDLVCDLLAAARGEGARRG